MAFCLWLLWLLRGGLAEDGLVDMTHMLDLELDGPLCDPSRLPEIDCEHTLWQRLLELLCRHCSANHCVSNPELAEVAHAVMQLYTTMLDQNLETFGCKHGLVAAVLFHSEHVALDFRRPSAEVEALSPPKTVSFNLTLDEMRVEPAVVETRLKSAGVPIALVNMSYLEISDSDGYPVRVQTGDDGVHTLESERDPTHGGFPLRVRYRVPPTERRFFSVQRFFAVSQGHEHSVLSIYLGLPVMSLAPFPFHTAKLYSLRRIEQEEYDAFVADISMKFSRSGLAHVVLDNDYTLRFWDVTASHSDEKGYLQNRFGLDRAPDQTLQRLSLFVPFEERSRALQLFPSSPKLIDLGLGHVQYGEQPFGFASSLNFRVMCSSCLWVSIYFYVTEALGLASTGPGMTVIPLAFWVPCRIPADELFPVANLPLGPRPGDVVPRPPLSGSQLAKQRWSGGSDPDPVFEAIREHYAVKDLQSRRRSIYYGKCRESLLRRVPQAVPELLPMHDMSSFLKLSMEKLGDWQMHKAAGLELYQDKIQLAKDFEARGYHVPKIFYASYAEDFDVLPTLQALEAQGRAYVAKASHLCCSQGVFVMDSGVERLTNQSLRPEDIQQQLQHAYAHPLSEDQVDPKCGDWGTVEAGKKPGVLVEELYRPSLPASFLDVLGADWVSPDVLACHLVWSTLYLCRWEINVRRSGERHTELLGTVFRDGSCLSCRYPLLELVNWPSTVQMLEALLPHTDYVRISIFLHETREPVINEVEYTTGGLEVFPVPIAREWTLRWLEGYYAFLS